MPAKKARKLLKADVKAKEAVTEKRNLMARSAASKTKNAVIHLENVTIRPETVEEI